MHEVTYEEIRAAAEPVGNGWGRAFIRIEEGDVAPSPGSTKWSLRGVGVICYYVAPEGGLELRDYGTGVYLSQR